MAKLVRILLLVATALTCTCAQNAQTSSNGKSSYLVKACINVVKACINLVALQAVYNLLFYPLAQ